MEYAHPARNTRPAQYADCLLSAARKGRAYGFRFKDWTDYKATAQALGTGDGTTKAFQLVQSYTSGVGSETRTITKPVLGTVAPYLGGIKQTSGWSINTATGVLTFTVAPAQGVDVTADFEFDVPVRFDTDSMAVSVNNSTCINGLIFRLLKSECNGSLSWLWYPMISCQP